MDQKFFIIGFMAAGKTTLAREISMHFHLPFFDSDEMISQRTGCAVNDIFQTWGEKYFRRMERDVIHELMYQKGSMVASLGGGSVCQPDLMDWLNRIGITIWLDTDWLTIENRLSLDTTRPLNQSKSPEEMLQLRDHRSQFYQKCQLKFKNKDEVFNYFQDCLKKSK